MSVIVLTGGVVVMTFEVVGDLHVAITVSGGAEDQPALRRDDAHCEEQEQGTAEGGETAHLAEAIG